MCSAREISEQDIVWLSLPLLLPLHPLSPELGGGGNAQDVPVHR